MVAAVTVAGLAAVTLLRGREPARGAGGVGHGEALPLARDARLEDGPAWPGELDARGIQLPVPAGYVRASECATAPEPWRFPGMTRDQVTVLARDTRLPEGVATSLAAGLQCDAAGCSFTPPADVVGALPPEPRGALYRALRRLPGNRLQAFAYLRPRALGPGVRCPASRPTCAR